MIPMLPKWNLHNTRPSFYDSDTVTMLELAAKLHGTMNTLIDDYNKFVESVNKTIEEFESGAIENFEVFKTAMRQEFQDFIDVVNLEQEGREERIDNKIAEAEQAMNAFIEEIRGSIDELMNTEY